MILTDIYTEDITNRYFQRSLDYWQKVFEKYEDACHDNQLKVQRIHGNVRLFDGRAGGNRTHYEPTASQKSPPNQ